MADVLYLTHRIPYPPDKGDKVRSFHILKQLLKRHRVFLGTFIDDPSDRQHLEVLRRWCADVHAEEIRPLAARLASLRGLVWGEPLSLSHYRHRRMARWVGDLVDGGQVDAAVVFSSAVAPFVLAGRGRPLIRMRSRPALPVLLDFVDMDSAKWAEYGRQHAGLSGWIYRREGVRLAEYERWAAQEASASYFVAANERRVFIEGCSTDCPSVKVMGNGVDADHFDPTIDLPNPFDPDEQAIVFTGAMDYWPNSDAVSWFVQSVLPGILQRVPRARFHVVGRSPTQPVRALAGPHVVVTGTVPDVRPYLRHARVVVAPLRLARGIQNKVLEAMAMAAPVVAATDCARALEVDEADGVRAAESAADYVNHVTELVNDATAAADLGQRGRTCVRRRFSWEAHLSILDQDLRAATCGPEAPIRIATASGDSTIRFIP